MSTPPTSTTDATLHSPTRTGTVRIALTLAVLAGTLGVAIINIALPGIALDFGATSSTAQWTVTAYLLAMTAATIVAGRLGDLWGDAAVLGAGLTVLAVGAIGAAVAPSLSLLITARAVQGVGAAVALVLAIAMAARVAPEGSRGAYLGGLGATSALAQVMGPSLGGGLIELWDWRSTMWLLAIVSAMAGALTMRLAASARGNSRATPTPRRAPLNATSAVALTVATASAALVLSCVATWSWPALTAGVTIAITGYVLAWRSDGRAEARGRTPVMPHALLAARPFRVALTTNALVSGAMMTMLLVPPYFLMDSGFSAAQAGAVLAVGPALGALTGVYAGRLVDSCGARPMRTLGAALVASGSIGIALLTPVWGWWGILVPMIALTPGFQAFMAANTAAAMQAAGEDRGGGAGTLTLARNLGQALATSLTTGLMAMAMALGSPSSGSTIAVTVCFLGAGALAALALIPALLPDRPLRSRGGIM